MKPSTVMTLIGAGLVALGGTLGAVEAAGALDLSGPQSDPDPQGAPMPASTPSDLWAGPLAQHQLAPLVRKGLDHHPALVAAAAARPGVGTASGHAGLAAVAAEPRVDAFIAERLRLTPAERAWALDPSLAAAAAAHCPAPELGVLCDPMGRAVVEAQVDAALAPVLLDEDSALATAALGIACDLGVERGRSLLAAVGEPQDARRRAIRLRLLACAEGPDAGPELQRAAEGPGAVAAVAVLELRRLGLEPGSPAPGTPARIAADAR